MHAETELALDIGMDAVMYRIADRTQTFPGEVRHHNQFTLSTSSKANADIVLGENWSLYCLDIPGERALFVELPPDTDLADEPFVYGAQFEGAVRAASVPMHLLPELATQVAEPEKLALLMSTGRCGSTLASRIFAQIPGVWSLSEPDWFTNLAFARFDVRVERRDSLIAACTRLTCRPPPGAEIGTVILKPRSEMMIQATAYIDVLEGADAVFLYRDCFGFVNSLYRFAQRMQGVKDPAPGSDAWEVGRQLSTINAPMAFLSDYFAEGEDIQMLDLIALGWVLRMRAYLQATSGGMRFTPIHYDDLYSDRNGQTAVLLANCGIDSRHLDVALNGFKKDAHSVSVGENSVPSEPISAAQRARVAELVGRWGMSDFVTERLAPVR